MSNLDVVDQILEQYPYLKPDFSEWQIVEHEQPQDRKRQLGSKLGTLSLIIKFALDKEMPPKDFSNIFNIIETFLQDADEDERKTVEIMFFEGMINWATNTDKDNIRDKYAPIFFKSIGPISKKLCQNNDEFWGTVNSNP
jgi:hypothetical protein